MAPDLLPPLIALRALEASARLGSFARAADELGVTPSAITQHVRTMESWVGAPLFRRTGRQVFATERLTAVQQELSTAFDELVSATRALRAPSRKGHTLSISAPPSFASKWLQPRLDRFRSLYNEYDVWISADLNLVDFSSGDIDIAIRYGSGLYEGLVTEKLLAEQVSPVAAPSLIEAHGPFKTPSDLLRAPLLHDSNPENDPSCPDWEMWLKARGAPSEHARRGLRFNQTSMVIEEAAAGRGVALAKHAIAAADIEQGKLQRVFDDATPLAFAYYLVWPRGRTLTRPVRAFIAWLKEETLGAMIEGAGI